MKGAGRCQPGVLDGCPPFQCMKRLLSKGSRNWPHSQSQLMSLAALVASAVALIFPFLRPIGIDPFRDGVAVSAEGGGSVRNALLVARIGLLNVKLLEFVERFA